MNDQIENVAHQLFSGRRYFVDRILTNLSEDHAKLIIFRQMFLTNGVCQLEIKGEINQQ